MTKTNKSWEKIFDKYKILDKIDKYGHFIITSSQINKFREARLMAKFDHKKNLPQLFIDNKLSILPISRGSYVISHFEAYEPLEYNKNIISKTFEFPDNLESINPFDIYSESISLNCAYIAGMINEFLDEEFVFHTISGRMASSSFDFYINNTINNQKFNIKVKNSQIEIDGGYECSDKLILIEAKNSFSSDFLVRQLYYPFRLWTNKIDKEVVPVFLTYTNDIWSFFEYRFEDPKEYNSLKLIKQKNYIIEPKSITIGDIEQILYKIKTITEPRISYPQANSFERVINLLEMLVSEELDKDYLTHTLDVHPRQTNYYTSACMYLGLVNKKNEDGLIIYYLNEEGKRIMGLPYREKYLEIVKKILQNPSFNESLKLYFKTGQLPSRPQIATIMEKCNVFDVKGESTFIRRASTVRSWMEWILNLVND